MYLTRSSGIAAFEVQTALIDLESYDAAIAEYTKVKKRFSDAIEAIQFFNRKEISLDEVTTIVVRRGSCTSWQWMLVKPMISRPITRTLVQRMVRQFTDWQQSCRASDDEKDY